MDQKRKIWIGTAIAAVAILYFTGTLVAAGSFHADAHRGR